jgi:hypothetical protein
MLHFFNRELNEREQRERIKKEYGAGEFIESKDKYIIIYLTY